MKLLLSAAFTLCSTCALAWGSAHNAVARLCGEYMPPEVKAFLGSWNGQLEKWCHYPDMQMVDGTRRFMFPDDMRRDVGEDAELFIKWGFNKGDWLHRHVGRAVSFANLQRAFREGKPKLAAFCISELSHSLSDQGALNHAPILQFTTYSRFKGIDYGWKHDGEFTLSNGNVAAALRSRLSKYAPKTLARNCAEATYEVVMDCYRQSEISAEEETAVAFGTKPEHDAAMTRVVAAQIESILDAVHTAWTLRNERFEVTRQLLNGIGPREEARRRLGDPRAQAVYKGLFNPALDPPNPKATVGIVCEPFGSFHVRVLSYVGKMLVASAARTLRDGGYAVRGISFWDIENNALPSPKDVRVVLLSTGQCTGMSKAQAEAFKKYRAAGGRLFVMGGSDPQNITGLSALLQLRTDDEVPVSSKWAQEAVGDWQGMRVEMADAMKRTGPGPHALVRNPNFDGFCKPCCMWSLKDAPDVTPLASLSHNGKSFTAGGIARGVCWMPEYLFLPFLFSRDATANWAELRLDSFASKVMLDAMDALVDKVLGPARRVPGCDDMAMAVCTEGDRLYAAAGNALVAYDISSPLEPVELGRVEGMDNRRQITARNGFVYVVSRETGLRIVDARNPKAMRICSRFDSVEFATGIDVAGDVAFLSERINGVECVDVSDPENPAHICIRKTGESQSVRYRDGYLYSGEWGGGNVTVFDARDMRAFRPVAHLDLHGFGDGLELDGNHLYCSTGHDAKHTSLSGEEALGRGRGMDVFSLDDPARPKWVSRVDFPRFKPRNEDFWTPRVSCGLAFCCDSHNGLFVVDVKDPARPRVIDRFRTPQPGAKWPSGAISSLAIGKGCVYVTSFPGGLFVIPVAGLSPAPRPQGAPPVNASHREPYPTDDGKFHVWKPSRPGQARTAVVAGDLVYAACGDAGLHVLRIKPDGGFERVGGLPESTPAYDCAVVDGKLLVAEGLKGFALYRIENGTALREETRRPALDKNASVAYWTWRVDDKRVALSGRCSGYQFYDLANLSAEKPLFTTYGTCSWDKYPCDRAIDGVYPILVPYQGVKWIDVSGTRPREIEFQKGAEDAVGSQCHGICAFGADKFLYTLPGGYALAGTDRRFCATRPLPPVPGLSKGRGYFGGIPRSDGRLVALTGRSTRRVAVFDFSDPEKPVLSRSYSVSGNPDLAAFHKGRVVVPCGHQGVLIENLPPSQR